MLTYFVSIQMLYLLYGQYLNTTIYTSAQDSIRVDSRAIRKKAFVIKLDGAFNIAMNYGDISSEQAEKAILAEELGHCYTDSLYTLAQALNPLASQIIAQAERKAKDWATRHLVPLTALERELKRTKDIYELAETFNVEPQTIREAIELYRRKK